MKFYSIERMGNLEKKRWYLGWLLRVVYITSNSLEHNSLTIYGFGSRLFSVLYPKGCKTWNGVTENYSRPHFIFTWQWGIGKMVHRLISW